jgi:ribosomal protein S18 acetylase RimI-like enzyme
MNISWRSEVLASDIEAIRTMVTKAAVFSAEEIDVAVELAEDRLKLGHASHYHFILANENLGASPHPSPLPLGEGSSGFAAAGEGKLIGYTCFGRIPLTDKRYDLYWIVVDPATQKHGVASQLMVKTEEALQKLSAKALYAETSSRDVYIPAHNFYRKHHFAELARIKDMYADGDDKMLFGKRL